MKIPFIYLADEGNRYAALKKQIISRFVRMGDLSIAEICRDMNVSIPTITKLVNSLVDEGWIIDLGEQEFGCSCGRKPILFGLNKAAGFFVGVEIRQSSLEMEIIDFKGDSVAHTSEDIQFNDSMESLDIICKNIDDFISSFNIDKSKIFSINVNISGRVNATTGYSYSFFFNEDKPLTTLLEERLHCTVYIENDTRAATYGEYICGGYYGKVNNMLYINLSWGLGLGMIINGKLYYGKSGFSGELGHAPLLNNDVVCRCGKRGCLETGASGSALYRMFMDNLKAGRSSVLSNAYNSGKKFELSDLIDALNKGDVLTIELLESIGQTLGKSIAGLINIFNPETIVIGGVLSRVGEYIILPLRNAVNKYSLMLVNNDTEIVISSLGDVAGVKGACLLARSRVLDIM